MSLYVGDSVVCRFGWKGRAKLGKRMEWTSCTLHTTNIPQQRFPNLFAPGSLLASKNNQGSSHPYSRKQRCPGDKYPEFAIHISEVILDNYEYIPVARVTMHCMN
jgi:hypothetical protein